MSPRPKRFKVDRDAAEYRGPYRPYDLVKEGVISLVVVSLLTVLLAALFGSPDEHAVTLKQWAVKAPTDFMAVAASELNGSSGTAGYGPPYNDVQDGVQRLGPVKLPNLLGVTIPIDTANDFVLNPLRSQPGPPALRQALSAYTSASAQQRQAWADAYVANVGDVKVNGDTVTMPQGDYGPVATIMSYENAIARSGALDQALITGRGFYTTDYTRPSLFLGDDVDGWFGEQGAKQSLSGDQWGMMNETGSYPGQAWLWLYTFWYQVPPFNDESNYWGANADVVVWALMLLLTLVLALVPFIPGLRSIPRWLRVYRIIWRVHYREADRR